MKANELRIGNLVSIPMCALYATVDVIDNKRFCIDNTDIDLNDDETSFDLEDAKPIPLTEEWLYKLGFEKKSGYAVGVGIYFNIVYSDLMLSINTKGEYYAVTCPFKPFIRHVHQLQNLYFALTGSELVLKPIAPEAI